MTNTLPDALEAIDTIARRLGGAGRVAVFLDFDGTLAPIVERPEEAGMSEPMRRAVGRLAEREACRVAVISGRDLEDVRRRVGLDGIAYAGSHGFDIRTADGQVLNPANLEGYLPALDQAEETLGEQFADVPGAQIERKRYSLAVHYRRVVDPGDVERIRDRVEGAIERADGQLRLVRGKKVLDLQPDLDWHKGRAVEALMDALGLDGPDVVAVYVGDDVTDEDAFRALNGRDGVTVLVSDDETSGSERPRETAAGYRLDDPDAVRAFIDTLAERLS